MYLMSIFLLVVRILLQNLLQWTGVFFMNIEKWTNHLFVWHALFISLMRNFLDIFFLKILWRNLCEMCLLRLTLCCVFCWLYCMQYVWLLAYCCHHLSARLSVTLCTMAKRYILQQMCLKMWIGSAPYQHNFTTFNSCTYLIHSNSSPPCKRFTYLLQY